MSRNRPTRGYLNIWKHGHRFCVIIIYTRTSKPLLIRKESMRISYILIKRLDYAEIKLLHEGTQRSKTSSLSFFLGVPMVLLYEVLVFILKYCLSYFSIVIFFKVLFNPHRLIHYGWLRILN